MRILAILLALLPISSTFAQSPCPGRSATAEDRPHGANEIIELSLKTVKRIRGRVTDLNEGAIKNAVIEVYNCAGSDCNKDYYRVPQSKQRLTATVADEQGRFCFHDLPAGRYVLLIGTHESDGFQAIFARINLDRNLVRRLFRSGKELKIALPVGT